MNKKLKKLLLIFGAVLGAALVILIAYKVYIGVILPQRGIECSVSLEQSTGNIVLETSTEELKSKDIVPGGSVEMRFNPGYAAVEVPVLSGDYLNPATDYLNISNGRAVFQSIMETNLYDGYGCKPETRVLVVSTSRDNYSDVEKAGSYFSSKTPDFPTTTFNAPNLKFPLKTSFNQSVQSSQGELKLDLLHDLGIYSFNIKNRKVADALIGSIFKICDNRPSSVLVVSGKDYDNASMYLVMLQTIAGCSYEQIVNNYRNTYAQAYNIDPSSPEIDTYVKHRLDVFLHQYTKTPDYTDLSTLDYKKVAETWLRSHGVETHDIIKIQTSFSL